MPVSRTRQRRAGGWAAYSGTTAPDPPTAQRAPTAYAPILSGEKTRARHALISCCGHLGLLEEANEYIAVRNKIDPPLRLSVLRRNLAHFAYRDVFIDGLAKAGVPE